MYAGQVVIKCTPPFGTAEYYQSMENDAAKTLLDIVAPFGETATGFTTGKAFLDCLRIVLAKISILDWTSMDKSTQNLVVSDVKQKLPGILRTGCHVPQSLVVDENISPHLKEDVMNVGTREKTVISTKEVCEAYPGFITKWMALNDAIPLDNVSGDSIDLGFDVTVPEAKNTTVIQNTLVELFTIFSSLRHQECGRSRLTAEDQKSFDDFVAFVLRRRKLNVSKWLRSVLDERLSEVRSKLEQRYADPLVIFLSRCQHRCARCQLGCMHSVTHSTEVPHNCSTDHRCRGNCEYAECRGGSESAEVPSCSRSAEHEGKCECEKGEHACGQ